MMTLPLRSTYLLSLMSFLLLTACAGEDDGNADPQTGLIGTWRLTDAEITLDDQGVRQFYQAYFNEQGIPVTDDQLDDIEATFDEVATENFSEGTTFAFQSDNTVVINNPGSGSEQETWMLNDGTTLVIDDVPFAITTFTAAELRLLLEDEQVVDLGGGNTQNITIGLILILVR